MKLFFKTEINCERNSEFRNGEGFTEENVQKLQWKRKAWKYRYTHRPRRGRRTFLLGQKLFEEWCEFLLNLTQREITVVPNIKREC